MARTIQQIPTNLAPAFLDQKISEHLTIAGFKIRQRKGVYYWQKGNGFFTAPRCIEIKYFQGYIQLEAYVRQFGSEMMLDGSFVGCVPKGALRSDLSTLCNMIHQLQYQAAAPPTGFAVPPVQNQGN